MTVAASVSSDGLPGTSCRSWKLKLALLAVLSIPAFSGLGLDLLPGRQVAGIPLALCLYGLTVNLALVAVCGASLYANIITVAAMITLPVIFSGAALSWLARMGGLNTIGSVQASVHYLRLCVTMLTVIPLALGLVASLPLEAAEQRLLHGAGGVTRGQKKILMALRVFNHICFTVSFGLLEIIREEKHSLLKNDTGKLAGFLKILTQVAIEAICSAVQFIPLWAFEIGSLPEPPPKVDQEEK